MFLSPKDDDKWGSAVNRSQRYQTDIGLSLLLAHMCIYQLVYFYCCRETFRFLLESCEGIVSTELHVSPSVLLSVTQLSIWNALDQSMASRSHHSEVPLVSLKAKLLHISLECLSSPPPCHQVVQLCIAGLASLKDRTIGSWCGMRWS
ncbi:hypothetical protein RRG08_024470 [Elysia crispata]|uniref:Uncharacterized protein n=1 Tax=Elysia crispata TaxID=231223 RepID=A0AAE1D2T7_9GAST|nr:hypothetical protein RRG08_024470 [Elysia crispata]